MAERDSLKTYFEDLVEDGTLDSSGVFTLDPKKVEWKLARYQLAGPELYPLFLLKAACAAGSTHFTVEYDKALLVSRNEANFFIAGLDVSEVELKKATLGQGEAFEAAKYLVVALSAARSFGLLEIISSGLHVRVNGEQVVFESVPAETVRGTSFRLIGRDVSDPRELLRKDGRWSPLPVSYLSPERKKGVCSFDFPRNPLTAVLGAPFADGSGPFQWGRFVEVTDQPDLILLTWMESGTYQSFGVHRGVSYPIDLGLPPGFQAVMRCDDLQMDLSYSGFVENKALGWKKALAQEMMTFLVEEVVSWGRDWSAGDFEAINSMIKVCWREGSDSEELRRFYDATMSEFFPLQPKGLEYMVGRLSRFELQHQVDLCLRMYRREVIKTRCYYPLTTAQWITEEIEFRKNAERDWKEADTIRLLVDFLFFKKEVRWNKHRCHPYLDLLNSYLGMGDISPDGVEAVEGVHPSWLMPLKIHYDPSSVRGFAPLELLCALESGRVAEALETARRSNASSIAPFRRVWFRLILDFYPGKLSWVDSVRLRARASFSDKVEDRLLKRLRALRSANSFEDWAVYHGIFEPGFWVLAVYYTCFCKKKGVPSHRFWCKVLLQASIGYPGEEGSLAESLAGTLRLPLGNERV